MSRGSYDEGGYGDGDPREDLPRALGQRVYQLELAVRMLTEIVGPEGPTGRTDEQLSGLVAIIKQLSEVVTVSLDRVDQLEQAVRMLTTIVGPQDEERTYQFVTAAFGRCVALRDQWEARGGSEAARELTMALGLVSDDCDP